MSVMVVVNDPSLWSFDESDVAVVPARDYLIDSSYANNRPSRVFNLCDAYRYQSLGYYVSLLAEARGHKPFPRARTLEDLQSQNWLRLVTENLDELIQRSLHTIAGDEIHCRIFFGRNITAPDDVFGEQLFALLQVPLLEVAFERIHLRWLIRSARAITAEELSHEDRDRAAEAAGAHFAGGRMRTPKPSNTRYDLAILHDPASTEKPSNDAALQKFEQAANALGMRAEFITKADFGRLRDFDGLFIRDTTLVNHYTYRFARQAAAEGLVVIDDPDSILKCSNKVYLAELLDQHNIPAPKTLLVYRENVDQIIPTLGLPCILKQPDSAFSLGVTKLETAEALYAKVEELLQHSDLVVAQEFLPTQFDWRVAILERRPLFVCKYFMADQHWQIIKRDHSDNVSEGKVQALSIGEAPSDVVRHALEAANCIGDGLYGVDLKQIGSRAYVIEVNDNPNIDAGHEDSVLKDALYRDIMGVFLKRIEERKRGVPR